MNGTHCLHLTFLQCCSVGILNDNYKILRWGSTELIDVLTLCQKQIVVLMFRHGL
jgi:hypothetical protein